MGERVRTLREERGWSITEMGRRLGASRSYLYQIEGDQASPTLTWLEKAASAFEMSVPRLLAPVYGLDAEADHTQDQALDNLRILRDAVNLVETAVREMSEREVLRHYAEAPS